MLGRLALERAPGELRGLADRLTVLLPWGSLLRAVAGGRDGLERLRGLCRAGAEFEVVVSDADLAGADSEALTAAYAEAGFAVTVEAADATEVAGLGTSWAKRLARSDPRRRFARIRGVAVAVPALRLSLNPS